MRSAHQLNVCWMSCPSFANVLLQSSIKNKTRAHAPMPHELNGRRGSASVSALTERDQCSRRLLLATTLSTFVSSAASFVCVSGSSHQDAYLRILIWRKKIWTHLVPLAAAQNALVAVATIQPIRSSTDFDIVVITTSFPR